MSDVFDSAERHAEFFVRLEALVAEFPELLSHRTPLVNTALIVLATYTQMDETTTRLYLASPGTSHFQQLGIATDFQHWSLHADDDDDD